MKKRGKHAWIRGRNERVDGYFLKRQADQRRLLAETWKRRRRSHRKLEHSRMDSSVELRCGGFVGWSTLFLGDAAQRFQRSD